VVVAAPGAVYFGTFDQRTHGLSLGPHDAHAELDGSRSVRFSDSLWPVTLNCVTMLEAALLAAPP